jgi:hypothetical protein
VARLQDGSYDAAETELVRTVRQVALHVPQVGPDCISILIAPPTIGQARVRFLPLNSHEAILQTASQNRRLTVAYTPWFVGPNLIAAPSLLAGPAKTEFSLGPYQIHLEGVGDSGGLLAPGTPESPLIVHAGRKEFTSVAAAKRRFSCGF